MALLFTRALPAAPPALLEQPREMSDEELEQIVEKWSTLPEQPALEQTVELEQVAPTSPAPRAPRSGKPEQEKAVRMMLDGQRQEAVDAGLMGDSTMRRYERAMRTLIANPASEIDCKKEKVNPSLVELIRAHANLERAR
jgi:hypothetical protein